MNKREVTELKRRLTRKGASFKRLAGCYVDMNRNKLCSFNRQFLTLEEDEFYKYLEIAGKLLSGTLGNNLLNLEFPLAKEQEGESQWLLMRLRETGLEDEALLEQWYDLVIAHYKKLGNFLILLYLDDYDVPVKTKDGITLDDSDAVYRYILAAICPVNLSDPGLGYREDTHSFAARVRDWVVGKPESGFLFPAFNGRESDIHGALFYTKDTKEPHEELMEEVLGCEAAQTATQQKMAFGEALLEVLGEGDGAEDQLLDLQQNLKDLQASYEESLKPEDKDREDTAYLLEPAVMERALAGTDIPEEQARAIENKVAECFGEKTPAVDSIIDKRALKNNELRLERNALKEQLQLSRQELKALKENGPAQEAAELAEEDLPQADVVLNLSPDKAAELRFTHLGGCRYLMIPVEEYETVSVNGEEQ